jgi:DNA invertase Pin-like site-specific DNA recombinase
MKEPYLDRKCALYLRVSTDQQALDGESLEEQEERLKAFCKTRNWKVAKVLPRRRQIWKRYRSSSISADASRHQGG